MENDRKKLDFQKQLLPEEIEKFVNDTGNPVTGRSVSI